MKISSAYIGRYNFGQSLASTCLANSRVDVGGNGLRSASRVSTSAGISFFIGGLCEPRGNISLDMSPEWSAGSACKRLYTDSPPAAPHSSQESAILGLQQSCFQFNSEARDTLLLKTSFSSKHTLERPARALIRTQMTFGRA